MNRYQLMFDRLRRERQAAFVPFVTLGDPDLETSFAIIESLINAGADCLELGFPYSDPIADGPVIQAASIRALESGITIDDCFELLTHIRQRYIDIPIGILTYSNLVFARGLDSFYKQIADTGIDSVLIADVPMKESQPFYHAAIQNNVAPVFIVPPNATVETIESVARYSHGYIYLLSRAGVTGVECQAQMPAEKLIENLSMHHSAPPLLGFGISTPDQVERAIDAGAAGVIVGSAVVKRIADNLDEPEKMISSLKQFISTIKAATCHDQKELV